MPRSAHRTGEVRHTAASGRRQWADHGRQACAAQSAAASASWGSVRWSGAPAA